LVGGGLSKVVVAQTPTATVAVVRPTPMSVPTPTPSDSTADYSTSVCNGVKAAGGGSCDAQGQKDASSNVHGLINTIINILSWIVGVIAVIMVIIGGLLFTISSGNSEKSTKARNTIIYALVGLVIVAMAQIIIRFVLKKL